MSGGCLLKTITISAQDFIDIAARDENHFFDIKEFAVSGKAVQKIAAAFSNADGGEFIVGVKDKAAGLPPSDRWEAIKDIEQFNGHLQALFEVKPALDVQYAFIQREGVAGYALRINIEKGTQVCTTADGTIYIRQGAQSLPVKDPERIQQLSFSKGAVSYEDFLLRELPTEQITEGHEIANFLADYSPKTDALEFCLNQNLLEFKSWQPRVAAALLFHPTPSAIIPKNALSKSLDTKPRRRTPKGTIWRSRQQSRACLSIDPQCCLAGHRDDVQH